MKRKVNSESGVYRYLQESGVLDKSPDIIALARKDYWNQVKREWKKERLKKDKEFAVSFTPSELKLISEASVEHSMSNTRFIKLATLAYVHKKYLVPTNEAVHQIKSLLSINYSLLQNVLDENRMPEIVGLALLEKIEDLEHEVLKQLTHPKLIRNDH